MEINHFTPAAVSSVLSSSRPRSTTSLYDVASPKDGTKSLGLIHRSNPSAFDSATATAADRDIIELCMVRIAFGKIIIDIACRVTDAPAVEGCASNQAWDTTAAMTIAEYSKTPTACGVAAWVLRKAWSVHSRSISPFVWNRYGFSISMFSPAAPSSC